ncbi:MAG TPA: lipid A deacylase LpxR family protein [Xanthobacteraceae bacterium]|nr:lipid A deacylase LpxR family protein [Xanthobacteraceae bacterium]
MLIGRARPASRRLDTAIRGGAHCARPLGSGRRGFGSGAGTGEGGPKLRRFAFIGMIAFGCCSAAAAADLPMSPDAPPTAPVIAPAPPQESGRFTLIEENDAFVYPNPTDWWYTQGLELNYLSAPIAGTGVAALLPSTYLDPGSFRTQRFELVFGQSIFTPMNVTLNPPDPRDRPYAGWLYVGAGLYQETDHHSLDHVQLLLGVVGPDALAEEIQNGFHRIIGSLVSQLYVAGWGYQLSNEPGVVLTYEHKWRWDMPLGGGFAVDVIPDVGVTAGNVFTYAETGAIVRIGQNLNADYGPARIKPAVSGTTWFDPSQLQGPLGWYFFVGAAGRAVARNIFLDGNTFVDSPRVEKEPLVGDFSGGLSFFWADLAKLDLVVTWRSKEFVGQSEYDRYGGINVSFKLP